MKVLLSTASAPLSSGLHKRHGGFGLLEAIVALVLISIAVMAAYDWINTNLITISRIQNVAAQTQAKNNVLAFMANINPMNSPTGSQNFADYTLKWQSKLIAPEQDQINSVLGIGLYRVGLYELTLNIEKPDNSLWFSEKITQAGYKRVRDIRPFF